VHLEDGGGLRIEFDRYGDLGLISLPYRLGNKRERRWWRIADPQSTAFRKHNFRRCVEFEKMCEL